MNKIKTNKVTYLAAAVLATASLLTVNTNNAKADTVKSDSQDIQDTQAKIQTAQTKLNQDKQHSGKDATSIPTKSEIDQARKAVERGERETANDLIASSDYVKAVKKYDGLAQKAYQDRMNKDHDTFFAQSDSEQTWYKNKSNYDKDMYQGSRETIENKANDYKHNKEDEQHQVDLDHITPDEYQEINEYAIRLINSVRSQTGRPNLILNKDVMKMAQVIADKYNEDGRSNLDGKGHDYKAVNDAARQFGLKDDPDNNSQYYEDLSGWPTITHTVSMDYIKQNIYSDIAAMLFNDHEWDHAASLLSIGDMNQDNDTKHYAFGMSISVLPNTNDVSTHYLIVPDNAYVHSNNPKVTPISNQADEQVTSLAQEKANLREAQAKYQALLDASKGASKPDTGSTAKPNNGNIAKPATNTIETVKHNVLMRKNRAFYLRNGKTVLKFKSYKQVVNYLLKHKISTEVRSNEVIKLTKNARFYTKSGKRTLHLIKRGKKLHISEFVMIKGHLYAHLAHNKFYIRATRLF